MPPQLWSSSVRQADPGSKWPRPQTVAMATAWMMARFRPFRPSSALVAVRPACHDCVRQPSRPTAGLVQQALVAWMGRWTSGGQGRGERLAAMGRSGRLALGVWLRASSSRRRAIGGFSGRWIRRPYSGPRGHEAGLGRKRRARRCKQAILDETTWTGLLLVANMEPIMSTLGTSKRSPGQCRGGHGSRWER